MAFSDLRWAKTPELKKHIESSTVALMLPCLNEQHTLAKVISDFRNEIPNLQVYVFDNGSTDRSAEVARIAGATVVPVQKRGKGFVVRKMFEVVQADYYIMVDSDDTYDAKGVWELLEPVAIGEVDMMVGSRLNEYAPKAFRKFHRFGNWLIMKLINMIFGSRLTDICSGYRVMSNNFVKNVPFLRDGFEVETELTVYSMIYGFHIEELPLSYRERPANSHSKLHTFKDGYKVLLTIVWLARDLRPLVFFGGLALLLFFGVTLPLLSLLPEQSFVHFSLTVLSISLMMTGLILNTLNVKFSETQVLYKRNRVKPASPLKHAALSELRERTQRVAS